MSDVRVELECWEHQIVSLEPSQAADLMRSGLVDVEQIGNLCRLVADSRVGVATGPDWEVRVRPRMSIRRLFFLLAYASDPKGWKDTMASFQEEEGLLDSIASGFAWHTLRALDAGVLRGYRQRDERLTAIRGRIRFGDQLARNATLPLPVEVTFDDYTEDIPENQIVATATDALLRIGRIPAQARMRLQKVRGLLSNVTLLVRHREVVTPAITRLNRRYENSLRLAELILRVCSIEAQRGTIAGTAFVFDLNKVFEDFVTVALSEAMTQYGGEMRSQHRDWLDHDCGIQIIPDLTWWSGGSCMGIADAKFKALEIKGVPNADAYQMLAYCTALDVPRGFLVYARDPANAPMQHLIRNSDSVIYVRTLDVEQTPETVLLQVRQLSNEIARPTSVDLSA